MAHRPHRLANTLTAPGLPAFTYNPDGEGRVGSVQAGSAYLVSNTQYNDFRSGSLPMAVTLGSSDFDTLTFDTNTGRLNQYKATVGSSSLTGNLTWNGNGSLAQLQIADTYNSANNQTCAYTHDDLARISKVDCGSGKWGQNFTYDAFGNITKVAFSGSATSFNPGYNAATNQVACTGCSHDSNGNLTADGPRPPAHAYAWDAEGNLSQFNGGTVLVYDALGRRVEQPNGSNFTEILYGTDGSKLALMNGTAVLNAFVPLPGGATAVYQGTSLAWYRHADWLGSSRIASTPSRALYYDGAYSPFGEITGETGTPDRNFTGQNQDLTSLFYDFPAREYHPGQGRWLSPDPLGLGAIDVTNPQSCNQYAYVGNSPLNAVDPEGLEGEGSCGPMCQCLAAIYAYYMGEGRYDPFFSLADAQNACMGLPTDTPGSGNNTGPGNGGGGTPPPPPPPKTKKCVGKARGLAGPDDKIGDLGSFPGVTVQPNTAAIIPTQWGYKTTAAGRVAMRPYIAQISGTLTGVVNGQTVTSSFNSISDVIGGASPTPGVLARPYLLGHFPGRLIIEVYGGKDVGAKASVTINNYPANRPCPTGTRSVHQ